MTDFTRFGGGSSGVLDALAGTSPIGVETALTAALHPKSNHTFTIRKDTEYFRALRESIRESGVQTPLLVRRHPTLPGEYEIIAGHTRHTIARELGITQLPIRVLDVSDEDADILMAESNIQRPDWLPSERARTFAVWLDALRRKAGEAPGEPRKGKAVDLAGELHGFDGETIRRYIKLNDLVRPLMDMTDAGRIPVKAAYQLAFLDEYDQQVIVFVMTNRKNATIRESAAKVLRDQAIYGELTEKAVREALGIDKKESRQKTVSLSVPANVFADASLAKRYRASPKFREALTDFIRSYIAEAEEGG
jgi:ParB family chromosome partitioning protein